MRQVSRVRVGFAAYIELDITMTRSLEQVLQSVSDVLFPAELGDAPVQLKSCDVDGDTPLHVLAWRSDTEGALMLIAAGADVNAVGDMGTTPLHVAISQGNRKLARALIAAGARTNIRSEFGRTAIEDAAANGVELE
jgi:ankyrin repeat protein